MVKIDSAPTGFEALNGSEIFHHAHLPLAAAFCRKLELVDTVNRLVPSKMALKPGIAVQAMVLDTLSGRTPLYRLEEFMAAQDRELLLGETTDPELFNDNNLGRALDCIFEAGSSKILTKLGIQATKNFSLDPTVVSYDTTSRNIWGDFSKCEDPNPPAGPVVTYGHSKDHRPDLKQFMTELLCVERGVPIFGRTLDGNSSDKTSNNQMLTRISSLMASHGLGPGAFVYVADSAMVTSGNLEVIGENTRFVSRLPANFKACSQTIHNAIDRGSWKALGRLAETVGSHNRPGANYKVCEATVEVDNQSYRAIVVHSDSHDKRRQKKVDRDIIKSEKDLHATLKKMTTVYHCEADALEAVKKVQKLKAPLHLIRVEVDSFKVKKRGRPPKNGPIPTNTKYQISWTIEEDETKVARKRYEAGCFIILSNIPQTGKNSMDAEGILRTYKGQYGVESDFAFLKDPIIVNDTFLKKPQRIDALGMILIIALLVWRLMERSMRAWTQNTGKDLPGWDKKRTTKPTSFMMSKAFRNIQVVLTNRNQRFILKGTTELQNEYLTALGLENTAFIDPRYRCKPIIPQKKKDSG
ncbi:MAG: transposase [Acidobacteria bacterium]|nr:MAG: transposase [Acidobacteriota bacterium]